MIGLPTETDDDIKGIASLAQRAYDRAKKAVPENQRGNVRVSISCALFVPKAQTPFQWDGQISPEEAKRRIDLLRRSVKYRAVDVHWHEPDVSLVEAMMSRGGRCGGDGMASGRPFRRVDRAVLSRRMEGRVRSVRREHGGNRPGHLRYGLHSAMVASFGRPVREIPAARTPFRTAGEDHARLHI